MRSWCEMPFMPSFIIIFIIRGLNNFFIFKLWSYIISIRTFERKLAEMYKVNVRVNLIFDDNSEKLVSGATVPSYFIKSIEFNNQKLNFKFPNDSTVRGKKWSYFIMSN